MKACINLSFCCVERYLRTRPIFLIARDDDLQMEFICERKFITESSMTPRSRTVLDKLMISSPILILQKGGFFEKRERKWMISVFEGLHCNLFKRSLALKGIFSSSNWPLWLVWFLVCFLWHSIKKFPYWKLLIIHSIKWKC